MVVLVLLMVGASTIAAFGGNSAAPRPRMTATTSVSATIVSGANVDLARPEALKAKFGAQIDKTKTLVTFE